MKQIIVFKEKHGNRVFDASTNAQLHAACLKVVTERLKEGCWYIKPEFPPCKLGMTEEQINNLPEGKVKKDAQKEWAAFQEEAKHILGEIAEFEAFKKIVEEKNGKLAYHHVICSRSSYEYEGFRLETVEDA